MNNAGTGPDYVCDVSTVLQNGRNSSRPSLADQLSASIASGASQEILNALDENDYTRAITLLKKHQNIVPPEFVTETLDSMFCDRNYISGFPHTIYRTELGDEGNLPDRICGKCRNVATANKPIDRRKLRQTLTPNSICDMVTDIDNFVAVDVETADATHKFVCEIGISWIKNGQPVTESWLVRPPGNSYASMNSSIHGLTQKTLNMPPNFPKYGMKFQLLLKVELSWDIM